MDKSLEEVYELYNENEEYVVTQTYIGRENLHIVEFVYSFNVPIWYVLDEVSSYFESADLEDAVIRYSVTTEDDNGLIFEVGYGFPK